MNAFAKAVIHCRVSLFGAVPAGNRQIGPGHRRVGSGRGGRARRSARVGSAFLLANRRPRSDRRRARSVAPYHFALLNPNGIPSFSLRLAREARLGRSSVRSDIFVENRRSKSRAPEGRHIPLLTELESISAGSSTKMSPRWGWAPFADTLEIGRLRPHRPRLSISSTPFPISGHAPARFSQKARRTAPAPHRMTPPVHRAAPTVRRRASALRRTPRACPIFGSAAHRMARALTLRANRRNAPANRRRGTREKFS